MERALDSKKRLELFYLTGDDKEHCVYEFSEAKKAKCLRVTEGRLLESRSQVSELLTKGTGFHDLLQ